MDLKTVKEQYDAVGSWLHMPTIKQIEETRRRTPQRLRMRLERLLAHLEAVVASPIFNVIIMGPNSQIDCVRCKQRIRRAMNDTTESVAARCPHCGLGYQVAQSPDGGADWRPNLASMKCATVGCPEELTIFRDELKAGASVHCEACGRNTVVVFGSRSAETYNDGRRSPTLGINET